ncbi:Nnf1 [Macleaya cordata]|uniref:Nnf1 n=1 Tax=Macleaya cordata TaxID=56857 RepID=A0A200R6Z1_MACCD|nr:Nnf1 [Macleaya cordata]
MDQGSHIPPPGLRQLNLKKSFKLGVRSLLTACSKEEFSKAFSTFNRAQQEVLYQLFIQVITSLHESIEEEFESICLETQVATALDTVEQLVEEQTLDILSQDKTNLLDVKQELSRAKKAEISYLTNVLEMAVEQNHQMRAHIESLKKDKQNSSATPIAVGKFRSWNVNYGQIS